MRDEFPESVKRVVAERAAYICANPSCREPTIGPHSDPSKSLKTGKACHIRAATHGGPRFDPLQSTSERKSIENAIWLCSRCSDTVDKDETRFPPACLLGWKDAHEMWIRDGGVLPKLPNITIESLLGFTLPEVPGSYSPSDLGDAREHRFTFENVSPTTLVDVDARVQLPEPIVDSFAIEGPVGAAIDWSPKRMQMLIIATGGGKAVRERPPLPTGIYRFRIDRIGPSQKVQIGFRTSRSVLEEHDMSDALLPSFMSKHDPRDLTTYVNGRMHYEYRGAVLAKPFFAPIDFDRERRQISVIEVRSDFGDWTLIATDFFS
jgi:hypothetical protein